MSSSDPLAAAIQEFELPCAQALLAGTLACMTAHAQAACGQHRQLMARKVAANLAALAEHPDLPAPFRIAASRLAEPWKRMHEGTQVRRAAQFHPAPGRLQ